MDKKELQEILGQTYNQENWKKIVQFVFPNVSILATPKEFPVKNDKIKSFKQLGSVHLNDGKNLALFELLLHDSVNIHRNRVELNNEISKYIDQEQIHGVLSVFEQGAEDYRFTFSARSTEFDEDTSDFIQRKTDTKRYTYVLGKNESCKTPAERFYNLSEKKHQIDIELIQNAFSVEQLSKEFFDKYKKQFEKFYRFIVNNEKYSEISFGIEREKGIRDFVKQLLGRIVFLYFLQKKGWMGCKAYVNGWEDGDKQFMQSLFENFSNPSEFNSKCLSELFHNALNKKRDNDVFSCDGLNGELNNSKVPYLNGGLFDSNESLTRKIDYPTSYFQELLDFFGQYNFTIDENEPNDHEVGIAPEMLGHIFENLLEDNKDKGAFYTPKEIVHYMCQESLIEYLCTSLKIEPEDQERVAVTRLLKHKVVEDILKPEIKNINLALDNVKICDPAIGSGAFPMGLLHEIFIAKQTLHLFEYGNSKSFDASAVKLNIIQNSIYGVDIEKGAVEIARLRFWLSLIIDEETPKSLPNLDFKILVGDSLVSIFEGQSIEIDWNLKFNNTESIKNIINDQQNKLYQLEQIQDKFFQSNTNKKNLKNDIKELKIEILLNQLNLTKISFLDNNPILGGFLPTEKESLINSKNRLYLDNLDLMISKLELIKVDKNAPLEYFDWKLNFPEILNQKLNSNPGFDIFCGNPPYIQLQKDGGFLANKFQNLKFETFEKTGDIYSLFYEKGIQLLKNEGVLTFITSNKWMRSGYGKSTRNFFCKHQPIKLIDLGSGVFESATVDTNILIIKKKQNKPESQLMSCLDISKEKNIKSFTDFEDKWVCLNDISSETWVISSKLEQVLLNKIETLGSPLKSLDVQINYGIKTGFNEAFIIDNLTKEALCKEDPKSINLLKPVLRGKDIKRYKSEWANFWLISTFPAAKVNIDEFPIVKKYLESFGKKIYQTGEKYIDENGLPQNSRKKTGNKWYETQDQISYFKEFEKDKIIYPNMTLYLPFVFDDKNYYTNQKCFIITSDSLNLRFLTGFLNSKISHYWIKKNCPELQGGTRELSKIFFENIPIPALKNSIVQDISNLVEEIIKCKTNNIDSGVLELKIDEILFSNSNLTKEEIRVIETSLV